jgi:acyl dehydratase
MDSRLRGNDKFMTIDYQQLKNWPFPEVEHTYSVEDTMRYALAVGVGHDPMDEPALRFVTEYDLQALPTMAVVLAYPGFWMTDPNSGINTALILHGEEALAMHRPLPIAGTVFSRHRIKHVIDKGAGKGAIVVYDKELFDQASGALIATITHTTFCRGEGGFSAKDGISDPPLAPPKPMPITPPDIVCDLPTLPQQALLYRLLADRNPLHALPKAALDAGFERPILHGLATYGVVGHALLKALCGYRAEQIKRLFVRFTAPVYPGETIRTEIWSKENPIRFRAKVLQRDVVVINFGELMTQSGA